MSLEGFLSPSGITFFKAKRLFGQRGGYFNEKQMTQLLPMLLYPQVCYVQKSEGILESPYGYCQGSVEIASSVAKTDN